MNKFLKLMMPEGDAGGGGGEGDKGGAGTAASGSATEFKWDFKDPEVKENFPKMFPGMKSIDDLAKTAIHQQRKIGQQGVQLPTKPEEFVAWAQTHLKAPKDGKGYDFKELKIPTTLGEDAKKALPVFAETLAKAGVTQTQAKVILESYYEMAGKEFDQSLAQRTETAAASKLALEKKWGGDFTKKMNGAEMALSTLGGAELVKLVSDSGLSNNSQFVEFLANCAELMKEDPATGKLSAGGFAAGKQQAEQEIDMLYADKKFMESYSNQNDPGFAQAQARMKRLYQIKHGELGRKTV
jgi:hypothetical protein